MDIEAWSHTWRVFHLSDVILWAEEEAGQNGDYISFDLRS